MPVKSNESSSRSSKEVDARITKKNTWEELSFDFTGIDTSATYTKVVVFFDFGEKGDDTTYYYDEITLN